MAGTWTKLQYWLQQGGGQIFNSDYTRAVIYSPENVATIEFLGRLAHEYQVSPLSISAEVFNRGQAAIHWEAERFTYDPFYLTGNIGLTRLPMGPTGKHMNANNGNNISLYRYTKQPDLAWEYLVTAVDVINKRQARGDDVGVPPQLHAISQKFSADLYRNIQPEINMMGKLLADHVRIGANHPVTTAFADFRTKVFWERYIQANEPINIPAELQEWERVTNNQIKEIIESGRKWWW